MTHSLRQARLGHRVLEAGRIDVAGQGTHTMADRTGLRMIGFVAATITGAVMLIAVITVHKTVADASTLETPFAAISPR